MLLNQFHEVESKSDLEFDSRIVIRALNDDMTSALHQLCQVMEQYGAERLFNSLRNNSRFTCDYGSMNVENLIHTLCMYYVLDTEEDFTTCAAESDRIIDQISDYANDAFFGSKTEARIDELGNSLSEPVICDFQCRHTDMVNDKIRDCYYDLKMCIEVQSCMLYHDIISRLFACDSFIYDVEHGAKFSVTMHQHNHDNDVYNIPSYLIVLNTTFAELKLSKFDAVRNLVDVAKFCITKLDAYKNDMSSIQLELLAREAVRVTC